jgi:hypothetical protein
MTGVVRVIAGLMVSAAVAAAPPPVGTVSGTPPLARDGVSQPLVVTCNGLIHWPWCHWSN